MSSRIKTQIELDSIREAAQISTHILEKLKDAVKPGVSPADIDTLAGELCKQNNVTSSFLGVPGIKFPYPSNICISVNDEVLHNIPSKDKVFQEGDIVTVDFGINCNGFMTDHCFSLGIEPLSDSDLKLLRVAKLAVISAVRQVKPGIKTGDLGFIMQNIIEMSEFNVVKEFVGHGIGRTLHESPQIPAYGKKNTGAILIPGMVICLEAQVVEGSPDIYIGKDGWGVYTTDGSKAAWYEYMVAVTEDGYEILTDTTDWPITKEIKK